VPEPDATGSERDAASADGGEEVRLAMALNGGVSLAVWMGGCAVELDAARRAYLGIEDLGAAGKQAPGAATAVGGAAAYLRGDPAPSRAVAAPSEVRTVYHALCTAFDRRLVIDIMSGASAGGINGALLAAATAKGGRRLHPDFVRDEWLRLGDFDALLHPTSELHPASLMRGAYFSSSLEEAFATILADAPPRLDPRLADPLGVPSATPLLDVTTTDIQGTPLEFVDDWGRSLTAAEHRARFRFRRPADYTAEALAGAARASASFPVAFEPSLVRGEAATRAGFDGERWVLDGGLLDNAPIAAALDLVPGRVADCQVRRYACYVNADPPQAPVEIRDRPVLTGVVGATVGLPRTAPFADQLRAVERATSRADVAGDVESGLLAMPLDALRTTAAALLPAYRRQRRTLALAELAPDPATARRAAERLGDAELPWLPTSLATPPPGRWEWGFSAAERAHHLGLDLIRAAVPAAAGDARARLLAVRPALFRAADWLERMRETYAGFARPDIQAIAAGADPSEEIAGLAAVMRQLDPAIRTAVDDLTDELSAIAPLLHPIGARPAGEALFGSGWGDRAPLTRAMRTRFIDRVLAIEVVRRAFDAEDRIVSPQRLRFVQLTPFAPTPILDRGTAGDADRDTPAHKLAGVVLGHFGGFYRRSWRANDFMWGRLDAAARIVDLLIDRERAVAIAGRGGDPPWTVVARALLPPDAADAQEWLVAEELPPGDGDLRARLERALEADMTAPAPPGEGSCPLTRRLCARAVQLEVLDRELPVLVRETQADASLGAGATRLGIPTDGGGRAMIEAFRGLHQPLPVLLGATRDGGEIASALAMRTITHAGSVAFAALRETKLPLARTISLVRVVLLPVAAAVARAGLHRIALLAGLWAAALYGAARMLGARHAEVTLRDALSPGSVLGLVAVVIIAGAVGVPTLRALRGTGTRFRIFQAAWAVALALAGGVLGVLLMLFAGHFALDQALVAPGAHAPPPWIDVLVLIAVVGVGGGRLGPLRSPVEALVGVPGTSRRSVALLVVTALVVIGWSVSQVVDGVGGAGWRWAVALAQGVALPVVAAAYLLPRPGQGRGASDRDAPRATPTR
jgi:patatin-related protein